MGFAKLASDHFLEESPDGVLVLQAISGVSLVIPGDDWLLKADFAPQGADLLLTGPDGTKVLIRDYFDLEIPPDLLTGMNAMISAELAIKLAGPAAPGQFALIENGPFAELAQAAESIGRVEATDGLVEAIRIDGSKVALAKGDDIFQGDTLVTAKGAAVGITFVDDTTFSLSENGRMVVDEMVYDPGTQEGQFNASLVQGVFSFVSGEIAKSSPDAMTLNTPVATIGIRGTKVAGRAAQEGAQNTISLLPETDAQGNQFVGQLSVTNQGGTVTLASVGATVQMTSAFQPPPPPVIFSPQQIQQNFGSTLTTLTATVAAKATNEAAQNAQEAEQAQAEAQQVGAEAEAATAEAEAAAAEAEAAATEAEASGDAEAIAAAEAAATEAEVKAAEAEAKIAEAEAMAAEADAKAVQAEAAQAEAEHAANEMQAQSEAFATFGQQSGDGPGGSGPDGPGTDAITQAAEEAARQAIAEGASPDEVFAAAADAAAAQLAAEGDSPEDIAAERAVAEQAYKDAIAAGASPEEAMAAAMAATEVQFGDNPNAPGGFGGDPNAPGGFGDDPNAAGGFGGDPNAPDGPGGTDPGGFDGPGPGGGDPFFGGGDPFFGGGDPFFGGGDPFFGGGDPLFGGGGNFYGNDPLFGGASTTFNDPFGGDTFDPLIGDIYDLGNVFDYIDHGDDTVVYAPPQEVVDQTSFAEVIKGTIADDTLTGGADNTNFYFTHSVIGGTDTAGGASSEDPTGNIDEITDAGGINQISFDGLDNTVVKFTIDQFSANTGSIEIWANPSVENETNGQSYSLDGTTSYDPSMYKSAIDFSNVGQYLFADAVVPSLSGGYSEYTGVDPSDEASADDHGDVIVMPSLEVDDIGYVVAGGLGDDTFDLNDTSSGRLEEGMDGIIAFGKGGGDTFNIGASFDGLLIGGITDTDNVDDGVESGIANDGIPDNYLNTFSYSDLFGGVTGISASIAGYTSSWWDGSSWVDESETSGVVSHTSSGLYNMIWDVGNFFGSEGNDIIFFSAGAVNTLGGSSGHDNIILGPTSIAYELYGDLGNDNLSLYQSTLAGNSVIVDGDDGDLDPGSKDTLTIYGGGQLTSTDLEYVVGWEIWTLGSDAQYDIVLNDANAPEGFLTINAANVTSDWADINASGLTGGGSVNIIGGGGDDVLIGGAGIDIIDGGDGDDVIDGGDGFDAASYARAGSAVTVDLWNGEIQNTGGGGSDEISNIEALIGSAYNDTLTGDTYSNIITGGLGDDLIDGGSGDVDDGLNGGGGINTLSYASAAEPVEVTLTDWRLGDDLVVFTGSAGTDVILNFQNLTGSIYGDDLTGDANDNIIDGGGLGGDTLNGGGGIDTVSYASAGSGVTVTLNADFQDTFGNGNEDFLSNFENLTGSTNGDDLTGDANDNIIDGGGLGDDTLDGGDGVDTASYASAASAVIVTLNGTGQDTFSNGYYDDLYNFENLTGSAYDDVLIGDGSANTIDGGTGGDDTLNGAGGVDTVSYASAMAGVSVDLRTTGTQQDTLGAGLDNLTNFQNLTGSAYGDTLTGDANANTINGGAGNDTIFSGAGNDIFTGGGGIDILDYSASSDAILVDLSDTSAQAVSESQGSDTITEIETLYGSAQGDILTGDSNANTIDGGDGDDAIDGGDGIDKLSYASAAAGVTVTINGAVSGGGGSDSISNFENLTGSAYNDNLTGDGNDNTIDGGAGNDTLIGGDESVNTVSYASATAGVTAIVNGANQDTGGAGTDTLSGFTNLTGSAYDDILSGDEGDNTINGGAGADRLTGGGGADIFQFSNSGSGDIFTDFDRTEGDQIHITYNSLNYQAGTTTSTSTSTSFDGSTTNFFTNTNTVNNFLFTFVTPMGGGYKDTNVALASTLFNTNDSILFSAANVTAFKNAVRTQMATMGSWDWLGWGVNALGLVGATGTGAGKLMLLAGTLEATNAFNITRTQTVATLPSAITRVTNNSSLPTAGADSLCAADIYIF